MGCSDLYCPISGMPLSNSSRRDIQQMLKDMTEDNKRYGARNETDIEFWKSHLHSIPKHPWFMELIALSSDGATSTEINGVEGCNGCGEVNGTSDFKHINGFWIARGVNAEKKKLTLITSQILFEYLTTMGLSVSEIVLATATFHGEHNHSFSSYRKTRAPGMLVLNIRGVTDPQDSSELLRRLITRGDKRIIEAPNINWFHQILTRLSKATTSVKKTKRPRNRSRPRSSGTKS